LSDPASFGVVDMAAAAEAAAKAHAETVRDLIANAIELGVSHAEIRSGAFEAMKDLTRNAALQLAQGLYPVSTLDLLLKVKVLLSEIEEIRLTESRAAFAAEIGRLRPLDWTTDKPNRTGDSKAL
jgi:hypothetical protein